MGDDVVVNNIQGRTMKVLVVEDSRPDRLRFRSILELMGVEFCFAWDAKKQKVPDVFEIMKLIRDKIKPSTLLLDLAWTVQDDRLLQELLFLNKKEIEEYMIEKGNDNSNGHTWISGFRLLNELKNVQENELIRNLRVIITTQYIPPVAYGLRRYLCEEFPFIIRIIHKWREEKDLRTSIICKE